MIFHAEVYAPMVTYDYRELQLGAAGGSGKTVVCWSLVLPEVAEYSASLWARY
jgi:hypothetical protein